MRKKFLIALVLFSGRPDVSAQVHAKRMIRPADIYQLPYVGNPQISPEGKWVVYTVSTIDSLKDKRITNLWMVSWDGTQTIQLTSDEENESSPKWSPDGKYISFLSSRQESKSSQLWLMDRRGGEGKKLTDIKPGINDYAWGPDAKTLLLTITDKEPDDTGKIKTAKPLVIDRYQFKQDVEGYRYKKLHTHLYLFDITTKKLDTLTRGNYNEGEATWSPDGKQILFVSNRTADPDKNENTDIYLVDAKPGAAARQITTWAGSDNSPRWSPDGKWIAYSRSTGNADYLMYDEPVLALVPKDGGEPKLLSKSLDRPVFYPRWSNDGTTVYALVEDDRQQYVAGFSATNGQMKKIADGERAFHSLETNPDGNFLVTMSEPQTPTEIYALENGKARKLTKHSDEFLAPLALATVEGFTSKSSDGADVSGILYLPPGANKKLPLILFIHGGPVGQDDFEFDLARQMLAGGGYAVAAVNYRGSSGRGLAYTKIISADWGNKEVIDLHGAVDYLVKKGIADPDKLGVGGWSYGGILTDFLITADNRFKAACSGAGTGFTLSLYGVDEYINQYNNEIGPPWKNMSTYIKISYPLLKADKIKTPTVFFSGDKDFNVPTAGSEQMYQALRTLGVPTELVIYPGQFHGISTPSYQRDRYERYLAWYNKYLKK
ncbi:MAG: S9 family peptidase [Bacteroidetes bacterium]|nr:S9 family peptidase [Bacteroidota bacterium]MBS1974031.1 S9 family peptidase [Bacteroidota bacterium]